MEFWILFFSELEKSKILTLTSEFREILRFFPPLQPQSSFVVFIESYLKKKSKLWPILQNSENKVRISFFFFQYLILFC